MSNQKIRYVLGVDPAGDHVGLQGGGDGTTGFAVYDMDEDRIVSVFDVCSHDYADWKAYFKSVVHTIFEYCELDDIVVSIEDYFIYPSHATHHTMSCVPTARLLGYMLMRLSAAKIDYYIRPAVDVKSRWSNDVLLERGYIKGENNEKSTEHCHGTTRLYIETNAGKTYLKSHHLDAIRHALQCGRLEISKNRGKKNV